jgi:photosystem II stability/assembly factor-like uncharacterized protein
VLAISLQGGLYESSNSGTSWTPNSFFSGGVTLQTLAFSPAGGTVYAGTWGPVYSSLDSGATWTEAGSLPSNCLALNITVDPNSPTTLYIGGGTIYWGLACSAKSTDGGATWQVLSGLPSSATVTAFAIDPQSSATIYAASAPWNGVGGLFKSTDAGQTWTALNIAGLQNPCVLAVVINPSQPALLYAVANGSVYKTTTAGNSWALASTGLPVYVDYMDYVYYLAIAPSSPSVLYAGTTMGVFVTSNSGASWKPASLAWDDNIWGIAVDPSSPSVAYAAVEVRNDGFVAKINPGGSKLVYSTWLGGTDDDLIQGVALNSSGDAVVTGSSASQDFPSLARVCRVCDARQFQDTRVFLLRLSSLVFLLSRRRCGGLQRGRTQRLRLDANAQRLLDYGRHRHRPWCCTASRQRRGQYRRGAERHGRRRNRFHSSKPGGRWLHLLALKEQPHLPASGRTAERECNSRPGLPVDGEGSSAVAHGDVGRQRHW